MKAAVVEEVGRLAVRGNVPQPEPGEYECLCELLFGAVCAGTDNHLINGDPPFCYWIHPPFVLGHESIGEVVQCGAQVKNLKEGDLVARVGCPPIADLNAGWGGYAECGIATDWQAMKEDGRPEGEWNGTRAQQTLPAGTDPAAGTMFITWRETLSYTQRIGVKAGMTVLVIGSGGNGLAFANHARNLGAKVFMVGSAGRADAAKAVGCEALFDYKAEDGWARAKEAVGGADVVIDAVGKVGLANEGLKCLKSGGVIGIYGMDGAGKVTLDPGASQGTFTLYKGGYDEAETHGEAIGFFQDGKLDASIWLSEPYPLDKINDAFAAVNNREAIKPLIRLRG